MLCLLPGHGSTLVALKASQPGVDSEHFLFLPSGVRTSTTAEGGSTIGMPPNHNPAWATYILLRCVLWETMLQRDTGLLPHRGQNV